MIQYIPTKRRAKGLCTPGCSEITHCSVVPDITHVYSRLVVRKIFDGEEFSKMLRLWTNGYDVYTPSRGYIGHDYSHHEPKARRKYRIAIPLVGTGHKFRWFPPFPLLYSRVRMWNCYHGCSW